MSLTTADSEALGKREELTAIEKVIIDTAFGDMYYRATQAGMVLAGDDRAAALEAAFIRFLLASREL